MINEILFIVAVLVNFLFILFATRFGRGGLILMMSVNMILVSTFAPKLITVFGLLSNVGNIFYGSLFLASNLLIERYGKQAGYSAIWISFAGNILFIVMGQFALRLLGDPASLMVSDALSLVFSNVPRIALASIAAYLTVQYFNVWFYSWIKEKTAGGRLWLRHIASSTLAQFFDSIIFFTIAFVGVMETSVLIQAILVGFFLKTCIGVASTACMYLAPLIASEEESKVAHAD